MVSQTMVLIIYSNQKYTKLSSVNGIGWHPKNYPILTVYRNKPTVFGGSLWFEKLPVDHSFIIVGKWLQQVNDKGLSMIHVWLIVVDVTCYLTGAT